jgi:hypothetical protein
MKKLLIILLFSVVFVSCGIKETPNGRPHVVNTNKNVDIFHCCWRVFNKSLDSGAKVTCVEIIGKIRNLSENDIDDVNLLLTVDYGDGIFKKECDISFRESTSFISYARGWTNDTKRNPELLPNELREFVIGIDIEPDWYDFEHFFEIKNVKLELIVK